MSTENEKHLSITGDVEGAAHKPTMNSETSADTANVDEKYVEGGVSLANLHSIQGIRLNLLFFAYEHVPYFAKDFTNDGRLFLSIILVTLEVTVISTSLASIVNDLREFRRSNWVITSYLLTYVAFMVILAKLSDLAGRKSVLIICLMIFTIFSSICGAAQTMTQLIVFRAFQGFGGSGVYSVVLVLLFELVPPLKFSLFTSLLMGCFAISWILGPLIGGAIGENSTLR